MNLTDIGVTNQTILEAKLLQPEFYSPSGLTELINFFLTVRLFLLYRIFRNYFTDDAIYRLFFSKFEMI